MEPINQTTETESLVPGLCAFLLGLCYEFNREPGEITRLMPPFFVQRTHADLFLPHRSTIYPILSRLGVDALIGQMMRFREDDRFKSVTPESMVMSSRTSVGIGVVPAEQEGEIWFDWAFVDFWKSNHCA